MKKLATILRLLFSSRWVVITHSDTEPTKYDIRVTPFQLKIMIMELEQEYEIFNEQEEAVELTKNILNNAE